MLEYRDCLIFEQNGEFTVGTENNYEFNDCNLENFWLCDEFEAVKWNMEHGNKIIFVGLRGETECECVSYERYLKHLMRYKIEKDNSFVDEELIVPCVTFETINKAKEFIDWVWLYMTREKPEKICLEYDYKDVEAELHKMGCVIDMKDSITNSYKVTITIESNKEIEAMEYWVEADSFEEAVENVKNELDIE